MKAQKALVAALQAQGVDFLAPIHQLLQAPRASVRIRDLEQSLKSLKVLQEQLSPEIIVQLPGGHTAEKFAQVVTELEAAIVDARNIQGKAEWEKFMIHARNKDLGIVEHTLSTRFMPEHNLQAAYQTKMLLEMGMPGLVVYNPNEDNALIEHGLKLQEGGKAASQTEVTNAANNNWLDRWTAEVENSKATNGFLLQIIDPTKGKSSMQKAEERIAHMKDVMVLPVSIPLGEVGIKGDEWALEKHLLGVRLNETLKLGKAARPLEASVDLASLSDALMSAKTLVEEKGSPADQGNQANKFVRSLITGTCRRRIEPRRAPAPNCLLLLHAAVVCARPQPRNEN